MKFYRVIIYDFGVYGANGIRRNGAGLVSDPFTDRIKAEKHFNKTIRKAIKENRKISITLQLIETPDRMTVESWLDALKTGDLPIKVTETIKREQIDLKMKTV